MPFATLQRGIASALEYVPPPIVWRFSRRYIAGTSLSDALETVRRLNATGCSATIDVLGEDSTVPAQVHAARDLYLQLLDGIESSALDSYISVKLSEMGLRFDPSLCREVMREIAASAREHRNFVRIDMEDSSVTSATLEIYRELRERFDNVGIVIQSCLRRSAADVDALLRDGCANVRLCKGIYIEPPEIAFRDAEEVRESFRSLLVRLFEGGAERVGIATHDPALVAHAERAIDELGITSERYEFQMLLGVAGSMRERLARDGHPVRVYVPFGELWLSYSKRRLRENPNIVGHIVKNLFTKG